MPGSTTGPAKKFEWVHVRKIRAKLQPDHATLSLGRYFSALVVGLHNAAMAKEVPVHTYAEERRHLLCSVQDNVLIEMLYESWC